MTAQIGATPGEDARLVEGPPAAVEADEASGGLSADEMHALAREAALEDIVRDIAQGRMRFIDLAAGDGLQTRIDALIAASGERAEQALLADPAIADVLEDLAAHYGEVFPAPQADAREEVPA